MTKTQLKLIDRAKKNGGVAAVVSASGRGARGGRVSIGSRERAALLALAEAGKVVITHCEKDVEWNAGSSVRSTGFRYELVA